MSSAPFMPLVEELVPAPDPEQVFLKLSARPHVLFLDSARRDPVLGRYSFVTADPFDWLQCEVDSSGSFAKLAERIAPFTAATVPDLPPFQGGAAGLFSYDLGRELERLPRPPHDEFRLPALAVGLYDVVIAFDHAVNRAWIISQGLPEQDEALRKVRAKQRLQEFRALVEGQPSDANPASATTASQSQISDFKSQMKNSESEIINPTSEILNLKSEISNPQSPIQNPKSKIQNSPAFDVPSVTSNFTRDAYLAAVRRAIDYVHAGDIFQVNLAQRLICSAVDSPIALYQRLRRRNPATFAAYFDLGEQQIVSASPERFLQARGRQLEARPIKGTRRRAPQPEADLFSGDELRESEKDRAENVMIVDLLRNDLSRVCLPHSVRATQLCRVEIYEYVQHLVSSVRGELRAGCSPLDTLKAAFPGGSITGAPKVRAMEIIAELEPHARGPYCGSLAYLGFDGSMDSSILIRTITAAAGHWQFPVGGGIVAQSDPEREYEETWHKAEGMLRALRP